MKVYLAADHGGFTLKEQIKGFLRSQGYLLEDLGPDHLDPEDDYPDFVFPLAERVIAEQRVKGEEPRETVFGIVACRSGSGEVMAANKVKGVRATLSFSTEHARLSRADNDAHILCLPADFLDFAKAQEIVQVFLTTEFSRAERHVRRLRKIEEYEKENA